ncbi:unnamed protein product, partial [Phaeothamnion confervicola]
MQLKREVRCAVETAGKGTGAAVVDATASCCIRAPSGGQFLLYCNYDAGSLAAALYMDQIYYELLDALRWLAKFLVPTSLVLLGPTSSQYTPSGTPVVLAEIYPFSALPANAPGAFGWRLRRRRLRWRFHVGADGGFASFLFYCRSAGGRCGWRRLSPRTRRHPRRGW